ncbi:hypothetical protein [Streptomyces sp. NPDC006999]|uniref:hypothetical protein n=1 Tax=Streptomyces sp. NPDC006999 TaxID=3156909 RepID=UPI0033CBE6CF
MSEKWEASGRAPGTVVVVNGDEGDPVPRERGQPPHLRTRRHRHLLPRVQGHGDTRDRSMRMRDPGRRTTGATPPRRRPRTGPPNRRPPPPWTLPWFRRCRPGRSSRRWRPPRGD